MTETYSADLKRADSATFTGVAWTGLLAAAEGDRDVKLYFVRFEPGARTFWHAHSGGQTIVVTSGRCRFQREGGPVEEVGPGRSVHFEPGERHWHGAAADEGAEHIVINPDPRTTEWQEEAKL